MVAQERARGDVLRAQRGAPGPRPVALHDRRLRAMQRRQRLLDVDPSSGGSTICTLPRPARTSAPTAARSLDRSTVRAEAWFAGGAPPQIASISSSRPIVRGRSSTR